MRASGIACVLWLGVSVCGRAQETSAAPPVQAPPVQTSPVAPVGNVLFERTDKPADPEATSVLSSDAASLKPDGGGSVAKSAPDTEVTVSDEEREAVTFTVYDLDLHLVPARSEIEAHVNFTVRNDGKVALKQIALQVSSSLVWESLRVRSDSAAGTFVQHRINTDADHTGVAREAVLTLAQALMPGASLKLTAIYSGTITASGERLERIGAPTEQAAKADWDVISADGTALRGYGNVMWYPVAGAPVFLGDGAKLFDAVGRARLRQQSAMVKLRLTVEYMGDAPDAAYFCGRRVLFTAVSDNDSVPVAAGQGVATAEFAAQLLGFRLPSLFLTDRAATTTDGGLIQAVTDQTAVLEQYRLATEKVQPLLMDWLGTSPLGPLEILDHDGQPFEDGAFLVMPMRAGDAATLAPVLLHTLAHAWFASNHAWLDEGVAQFLSLLWVETNDGRAAGVARLQASSSALALAEPDLDTRGQGPKDQNAGQGESLIDASSDVYVRTKAAAGLWMLRSITSDDALKQALQLYRRDRKADATAEGFEKLLEQTSGRPAGDLRWFFDDWVYRDRGLPDLSIAYIAPRPAPGPGGTSGGWLVAVDVRNDGDAVAEVPVTVRSGTLTVTERLRIPGRSNAATRILFQGTPEEVIVNDGTVPEMRESIHTKKVVVKTE